MTPPCHGHHGACGAHFDMRRNLADEWLKMSFVPDDETRTYRTGSPAERSRVHHMGKLRMVLIGLVLIGAITSASGAGTFASFNASTENAGTFDTGVLVLSTQKPAGTICYSYGTLVGGAFSNGNANTSCTDTVVPVSTVRTPSA